MEEERRSPALVKEAGRLRMEPEVMTVRPAGMSPVRVPPLAKTKLP